MATTNGDAYASFTTAATPPPSKQCANRSDKHRDGQVDLADAGCETQDDHETDPPPPRTVFYVSPFGNGDGPGSLASPWRTIAASLAKLKVGDILFARGGDYEEGVSVNVPARDHRPPHHLRRIPG